MSQSIETIAAREPREVDLALLMFRYRGFTPIPFLILMIAFAQPTLMSLVAGVMIVFCGEGIRMWGVLAAGGETRTTGRFKCQSLVTFGPFAFVRNPLYIGNILIYTGFGVAAIALHPWLLIAAIVWFGFQYGLIISSEERFLLGRFGEEYSRYCAEVPRFIPRLTPYRSETKSGGIATRTGVGSERRTLQAIGLVTFMLVLVYVL